jgi:ABC-type spermidine/putrescine transport system permease subunit II
VGLEAAACSAVLAIALGHASLMLRGRRPTDGAVVEIVTFLSLAFGAIDAGGALLPLAEIVDDVDESWARILGSVLVLLIATTILAPLLRRLQTASEEPAMPLAA